MANSITLFKKYIDKLDEVYKQSAKTAVLDGDSALVQMGANTNEIIVPKISMDDLCHSFIEVEYKKFYRNGNLRYC